MPSGERKIFSRKTKEVINRVGSYIGLDLWYFIKNASYLTIATVVTTTCALLLSIAFARLLPKEIYGQYNYVLAIIGLMALLALSGMGIAVTQAVARGHDRVLIEGTKKKFKWSILGSIAILGVGIYYFLEGSVLLGRCFMISSLLFPFFENFQVYNAFLVGKKRFDKVAKYQIITQIFSVAATFLVIYFTRNLLLILIAYLASNLLLRGYFFRTTARNMESQSSDPKAIPFGKQMTAVGIPGVISQHGDKIIIGILLSFPEVAIYSIALGIQGIIRALMAHVASLSFPKLSGMNEKEAYSAVRKRYVYLLLAVVIVSGVSIVLSPYVIPFLYSQKYVDSILYAQILLAGLIFGIPNTILTQALFPAQKQARKVLNFEIVRIIIRTSLLVILTLRFGLLGVVLSTVITAMIMMVYSWKLAKWI